MLRLTEVKLPLDHPHFMESSHFNPRFSPILGNWALLSRNLALHLRGQAPRLARLAGAPTPATGAGGMTAAELNSSITDARLGIGGEDQRRLLHGLDFWWTYAAYAGLPAVPLATLAFIVFCAGLLTLRAAWRAASSEPG